MTAGVEWRLRVKHGTHATSAAVSVSPDFDRQLTSHDSPSTKTHKDGTNEQLEDKTKTAHPQEELTSKTQHGERMRSAPTTDSPEAKPSTNSAISKHGS